MGHRTENVELTVLCLIQDGNRILMQNRVKEDWKGYTLPGGHVELAQKKNVVAKNEANREPRQMNKDRGAQALA